MEVKHPPGPWNCNRRSAADRAIICAENAPIDICVLSNRDKTITEVDANARLIAAAPELLDALQKLCAIQEHGDGASWAAERDEAHAAIAKATGKTT